jgi:hypothetical protein
LSKLAFLRCCDRSADLLGVLGEGSETATAAERLNSIFFGDGQSSGPKQASRSCSWSATDLLRSGSLVRGKTMVRWRERKRGRERERERERELRQQRKGRAGASVLGLAKGRGGGGEG